MPAACTGCGPPTQGGCMPVQACFTAGMQNWAILPAHVPSMGIWSGSGSTCGKQAAPAKNSLNLHTHTHPIYLTCLLSTVCGNTQPFCSSRASLMHQMGQASSLPPHYCMHPAWPLLATQSYPSSGPLICFEASAAPTQPACRCEAVKH